jgi:hypothetical protein
MLRSTALPFVAFLLLTAGASAAAPAAPVADRATVITLSRYLGQVPSLPVKAAGRDALFLLDTAGGLTAVTPQLARSLGCEPWGQVTGFRMRGQRVDSQRCDDVRLELPGGALSVPTAGVWDLAKLLPEDAPPLDGSLALDAFARRVVTLDLAASQLVLETAASLTERLARATEVPVRFDRSVQGLALTPLVAVETEKGRLWMELDSGSDGAVIVGRHAAEVLHLDPSAKQGQRVAMTLAGGVPVEGSALVEDLILDGNIGVPVLEHWIVTIDLARERLWIAVPGRGGR